MDGSAVQYVNYVRKSRSGCARANGERRCTEIRWEGFEARVDGGGALAWATGRKSVGGVRRQDGANNEKILRNTRAAIGTMYKLEKIQWSENGRRANRACTTCNGAQETRLTPAEGVTLSPGHEREKQTSE